MRTVLLKNILLARDAFKTGKISLKQFEEAYEYYYRQYLLYEERMTFAEADKIWNALETWKQFIIESKQ